MERDFFTGNHYINSIIGEGTFVSGSVDASELLRIDGSFRGTIRSTGKVLIGKDGCAESFITAETVVVGGIVKGNIKASERIVVLTGGVVIGNIKTPRLTVEENVLLHGQCTVTRSPEAVSEESSGAPTETDPQRFNPMRKTAGNG